MIMSEGVIYEGVLLVDKPTGMTSHDVVSRARRIFKMKKILIVFVEIEEIKALLEEKINLYHLMIVPKF